MSTFKAYNLDNKIQEIDIGKDDSISNSHCQRCGCRYIIESGEWSNIARCPICYHSHSDFYSDKEQIESLEKSINDAIESLNFFNKLLKVVKEKNKVREKNNNDTILED